MWGPLADVAGLALIPGGDASREAVVGGVERALASEHPVVLSRSGDKPILPAAPHRGVGVDLGQDLLQSLTQKLNTHELDVAAGEAGAISVEVLKERVLAATHSEDGSPATSKKDGRSAG